MLDEDEEEMLPKEAWTLEAEPPRCRVDTWARACVPIKRKLVQSKARPPGIEEQARQTSKLRSTGKASSAPSQGRSPSRQTVSALGHTQEESAPKAKPQMIPLSDEHEDDPEEAEMRERKDREARRKRDEEQRQQQKVAAEAEEVARLAQVKDQMKNKPFTYDSKGDIIWVQPLPLHKLPPAHPTPSFTCTAAAPPTATTPPLQHEVSPRLAPRSKEPGKKSKKANAIEYTDSFTRFASQQPAMMEAMNVQPGVSLTERGRGRYGGERLGLTGDSKMTRKQYQDMVSLGGPPPTKASASSPRDPSKQRRASGAGPGATGGRSTQPSPQEVARPAAGAVEPPAASAGAGGAAAVSTEAAAPAASATSTQQPTSGPPAEPKPPPMRVVRAPDMGTELLRHAPTVPSMPPPAYRRVQLKRDALGYGAGTRERATAGTGTRFPGCAAPPPLGATMGHGLVSDKQKSEDFYFPTTGSVGLGGSTHEGYEGFDAYPAVGGTSISAPVAAVSPSRHGQLVSANPELTRKLFPR